METRTVRFTDDGPPVEIETPYGKTTAQDLGKAMVNSYMEMVRELREAKERISQLEKEIDRSGAKGKEIADKVD